MYIGKAIHERMQLLNLNVDDVADKTFMDVEDIQSIIDDNTPLEEIEEFDIELICNVLHCKVDNLTDDSGKEKDFLYGCMNRGNDDDKSINVKAKIGDYLNDYIFVREILEEL